MTAHQQMQPLERLTGRRRRLDQLGVEPDRHAAVRVVNEELTAGHPAPTFMPTGPRMITVPPVMYSQACSPAPSTTASAPELRMAKRSPTGR